MIRLHFWGTRGSIVSPGSNTIRYGGNTSCVQVIGYDSQEPGGSLAHKNSHIVIDGGTGITMLQPTLLKGPWGRGKGELHILLSHYHWDHLIGLPFFAPMFFKGNRVVFYGAEVSSLKASIERLFTSMYSPIKGTKNLSAGIEYREVGPGPTAISGFNVRTHMTNHPAQTLAYRLEYGGVDIVYATDHEAGDEAADKDLIQFARSTDLFIIDAQYTTDQKKDYPGYGHSSHLEAVGLARAAEAKQAVLFHHNPCHDDDTLDKMKQEAVEYASGSGMKVRMARDGMAELVGSRGESIGGDV